MLWIVDRATYGTKLRLQQSADIIYTKIPLFSCP